MPVGFAENLGDLSDHRSWVSDDPFVWAQRPAFQEFVLESLSHNEFFLSTLGMTKLTADLMTITTYRGSKTRL